MVGTLRFAHPTRLVAVILNAFFNGVGSKAAAEADAVAAASTAQHV